MKQEIVEHLATAAEFLREAEVLASATLFRGAIARAYYAMFHGATAALMAHGIERSSHHGIIGAFGEFLIKPGHIPKQFHGYLQRAFEARIDSDYVSTADFSAQDAQTIIERAREFLEVCRTVCC
jgi:hypothetical protein